MRQERMFEPPPSMEVEAPEPTRPEEARVLRPVRQQLQWVARDLEASLPLAHPARAIWSFLEELDLAAFYGDIRAVLDRPGRPTTDPEVLLGVWLLATVEGVGSARRLARLCQEHDAYRWMCGGVPINYHMLSDFRVAHPEALDDLLTEIVASLLRAKAVTLKRVAQDGMRVRASAGAASFRRKKGLSGYLKQAQEQVEALAWEREHGDPGVGRREARARERASHERVTRVEKALELLPQVQGVKDRQRKTKALDQRGKVREARASTTDPDARVMKMPDGGFRPAYNVGLATDEEHGVIVGVEVTSQGSDGGLALPMEEQVARRTGRHPQAYLMDGGFATREDITALEERGVEVYAPVRLPRLKSGEERYAPRYGDSPQVTQWRQRMATPEAKEVYKRRGATAEWVNAQVRQHGVSQFTVRGLAKVTTVMLLVAVAHNLMRWAALGP